MRIENKASRCITGERRRRLEKDARRSSERKAVDTERRQGFEVHRRWSDEVIERTNCGDERTNFRSAKVVMKRRKEQPAVVLS
jgi:hypothetical protein